MRARLATLSIFIATLAVSACHRGGGGGGSTLLQDATGFAGPYPEPALVSYTDPATGQMLTSVAYPGQVFLLVDPIKVDLAAATTLISGQSATVIAQLPSVGEYWAQVTVGQEATFISAVAKKSGVNFVGPNFVITPADDAVDLSNTTSTTPLLIGASTIVQFDCFRKMGECMGTTSHGKAVQSFLAENSQSVGSYDLSTGIDLSVNFLRAAEGASQAQQRLVVNMSLQSRAEPNDGMDRSGCEAAPSNPMCNATVDKLGIVRYASWKVAQGAFLLARAAELQGMSPTVRDNTLLVLAAGNAGGDITKEIARVKSTYPDAFNHMIIVGSPPPPMMPMAAFNHSTDPSAMLYAPGFNVTVPGTMCKESGTSFAAPQVANLASRLLMQFPGLTCAQLVQAITGASMKVNGMQIWPTLKDAVAFAQRLAVSDMGMTSFDMGGSDLGSTMTGVCSSMQNAGGDAPETFFIEVGKNSGTVQFAYDTFSIPDQITVYYNGKAVFDTGCCGCSGMMPIPFSGSTGVFTVHVNPNCMGNASGTAWQFTLSCAM